jgi:hypothetical protein
MDWECSQISTFLVPLTRTCDWIVDPDTLSSLYTDPTLMATRQFSSISIAQGSSNFSVFYEPAAIGIIAWDSKDNTLPIDCPDPLRDCDLDWIVRIVGAAPPGSGALTAYNPNVFDNTHLSKAKRRLGNQTGILACFSNGLGVNGPAVDMFIDARCLIKE